MSIKNNISNHVQGLKIEEKMVALAGLVAIIGCILPWRASSGEISTDQTRTWVDSGFDGQTWLIGWFITIFAIISIFIAFLPHIERRLERSGITRMAVPFFLGAESFFLVVIAASVLSYGQYINQELQYGLFITLFATAIITLGGFWGMRRGSYRKKRRQPDNNEFLRFQENSSEHSGMGYGEEKPAIQPEEHESENFEEDSEEEPPQQSLNI